MGEGNQPPWGWAQYFDHNCDNPSNNAGGEMGIILLIYKINYLNVGNSWQTDQPHSTDTTAF